MRYTLNKCHDYPWGDYGGSLFHGMSARGSDGVLEISRCGPFAPSLFFATLRPVVTAEGRAQIEASSLTGCVFRKTRKIQIACVDWQMWDLDAPKPLFYPEGGEPENYYLHQPHCVTTSNEMGDLWELTGTPVGTVERKGRSTSWTTNCEPNLDFITPADEKWEIVVVSESAREVLSEKLHYSIRYRPHDMLEVLP